MGVVSRLSPSCKSSEEIDCDERIRYVIFLEYAELFFFLLMARTYFNALERGVFDELRSWLVSQAFSSLFHRL